MVNDPNRPDQLDIKIAERISNWFGDPKHQPTIAALVETGIVEARKKPLDMDISISADLARANAGGKAFDPAHSNFKDGNSNGNGGRMA